MGEKSMSEEDKISKSEHDYIISQLKQAQKETAATLAELPARPTHLPQKSGKSLLLGIVIGVIVCLAIFFAWQLNLQKKETLNSSTVVERIQKLSTLATVKAPTKTIISKEDKKLFGKNISFDFPGSKRTFFMVFPGEVTAGVDLKDLTKKDITMDTKDKKIHITLPHATFVQEPSIDSKNIKTYTSEGIFRSDVNRDEGFKYEDAAKQKIKKEARQSGLLIIAEENARIAVQDFFKNLDYTATVTFK
jgi:hypothetical protein